VVVHGPPTPFVRLFDDVAGEPGPTLPPALRAVYDSPWALPPGRDGRPYVYSNFVQSRDGRVSFAEPGHASGGDVSGFDAHDRWLMALLRARADAVLVGDGTLLVEPEHVWTPAYLWPDDEEAFAELRAGEGRAVAPLQVILSLDGDLDPAAAVLARADLRVVVATTARGAERARALEGCAARLDVAALGDEAVDVRELLRRLAGDGVRTVLCEGGPRAYASLLRAGCVDEEFLTLSPVVVGGGAGTSRPALVEGAAFAPGSHPRSVPVALHRAGDLLYLRSRYDYG
jgi:riboflavin biosynthesis pyrimidine reductase